MRKVYFSIAICMLFLSSSMAQETKVEKENSGHHLGLFAGASSGYGLSYRYFKEKLGFQIATTPIFSSDEIHCSIGGEVMTSFSRTNITNFYGYLSSHYNYNKYTDEWDYESSENINITSITGLGVGFELIAGNRISFNWQLGYAFYYFDKDDWKTMLDGGFGIFYKF